MPGSVPSPAGGVPGAMMMGGGGMGGGGANMIPSPAALMATHSPGPAHVVPSPAGGGGRMMPGGALSPGAAINTPGQY